MAIKKRILGLFILFFLTGILSVSAQEKFPFLAVINKADVNLRAGPSINFEKLGQLKKGQEVVVLEKSYSWVKIRLPETALCYISQKFVQPRVEDIHVVTGSHVNLRAAAVEKANIIGRLNQGTLVRVKECANGWCRILPVEGSYGWVSEDFIQFKGEQVPPPIVVVEPSRSIYQKPQPKEVEKKPEIFMAVGRLEDLGRVVPSKDVRYKLTVDEKAIYYLQGESRILDPFIHYKVKVQGTLRTDLKKQDYPYPVIQVFQINLAL